MGRIAAILTVYTGDENAQTVELVQRILAGNINI